MKSRMLTLITILLSLSLIGCEKNNSSKKTSYENNSSAEMVESLDLTGLWIEDGKTESETHMVATIRDDGKIGVFFILEDDPTPWTYWVGTYEAPQNNEKEYSWTSDSTYGGSGMLASSASTKDFKYSGGKLSYEVTINGNTRIVELIRGDWDTSNIPTSAFGSVNSSEKGIKNIEIKESSWYMDGDYLYYFVVLHNANDEIAVEYPSFRITARDGNDVLLGTEEQTLSIIYPGQDFYYGSQAFSVDEVPTKVDIEMLPSENYHLKRANTLAEFKPLEVINTATRKDKFVGEISNPNNVSLDCVVVIVVGRDADGKVVYVDQTYVDNVGANSTVPFSVSNFGETDIPDVKYYANQW